MKASSKRPRVEFSIGTASQPPSSGDHTAEEFVDPIAAVILHRLLLVMLLYGVCWTLL